MVCDLCAESREEGDEGAALQAGRTVRGLCKGADPAWAGGSENKGGVEAECGAGLAQDGWMNWLGGGHGKI